MKNILGFATILFVLAPAALAQEPTSVGSLRLLAPTAPAAPPAETPAAPVTAPAPTPVVAASLETPVSAPAIPAVAPAAPAAAVTPAPAATGWTGPVNFAPVAIADLIGRVCRPSITGDGGDLVRQAAGLGLGEYQPAAENVARALPGGAVTWRVPTVEGELYLMGYGEEPMNCGAAVVRPMHEAAFNKVAEMLQAPAMGFVIDSTQTLAGDVHWARLKSPKGEFVDLMEYPPNGDAPGVLRADFLAD